MGVVTRFPNGISTNREGDIFGEYGLPDPTSSHTYFNDFDTFNASEWVITNVGAASQAIGDEDGGVLDVTNAAADDDSSALQLSGETFKFVSGKKLWFRSNFKLADVVESQLIMGLQITDTTPFSTTDGVYFRKSDASGALSLLVQKDTTASAETVSTMVNDTFSDVGFYYDGGSSLTFYVDGVLAGSISITNLPDDEELTVSFFVENGQAVSNVLSVDYIFVAKER